APPGLQRAIAMHGAGKPGRHALPLAWRDPTPTLFRVPVAGRSGRACATPCLWQELMSEIIRMGAVSYAPKVVTIWEGFKVYLKERGFNFDYVLYSNYEALVEALMRGDLQFTWNSTLAFVRAQRMARARGQDVEAIVMRD